VIEALYPGTFYGRLENGLRILVEEVASSRAVSVGIWVRAGSRDDPKAHPGLFHLLEHLLFKGTRTRDAERMSREIDAAGGYLNGATGRESTLYYAEAPRDKFSVVIEILADLVQHPAFHSQNLKKERDVVLEEIRGHTDDPEQYAYDLFHAELWEASHPLSRPVLGNRAAIETVTRDALVDSHGRFYQPSNMVFVVCGAIEARDVFRAAAEIFETPSVSSVSAKRTAPSLWKGRVLHERDTQQMHIYLGLPSFHASDADRYTLEVVNAVFGDGTGSRLFHAVRERRGLAYAVSSSLVSYSDAGVWVIYAGSAPAQAFQVINVILNELEHLREEGISPTELAVAKAKLRGQLILGLEANANRMGRLGTAVMTGREILSPEALVDRVEAVSVEDASRVIGRFARADLGHLSLVGPRVDGLERIMVTKASD
jgi:predicted Zn-dependent peptidase